MGFALDLSGDKISIIANQMFKSINSEYKYCILAELQRGLFRHIIAFKTILFIHGYLVSMPEIAKKRMIFLLKKQTFASN